MKAIHFNNYPKKSIHCHYRNSAKTIFSSSNLQGHLPLNHSHATQSLPLRNFFFFRRQPSFNQARNTNENHIFFPGKITQQSSDSLPKNRKEKGIVKRKRRKLDYNSWIMKFVVRIIFHIFHSQLPLYKKPLLWADILFRQCPIAEFHAHEIREKLPQ